ncbi:MAG: ABC transporter permease [Vicinamibacterales bacterium]
MTTLLDDVRHGVRILRNRRMFAATAVLTLGLGIGASTAVFSAVDTILRHPPAGLAEMIRIAPHDGGEIRQARLDELEAWRAALSDVRIAAYSLTPVNVGRGAEGMGPRGAERVLVAAVDREYFGVVDVAAALGRTFGGEADTNVVVLSDPFWRRRFGGRREVIGDSVPIDGLPHTVIGVLPEGHRFPRSDVAMWRPLGRRVEAVTVIGRLARDAPLEPLRDRLAAIHRAPAVDGGPAAGVRIDRVHDTLLNDRLRAAASIGHVTVLLVLLIACANVANLIVARNVGRRPEFAARFALGASRGRLARQLLTESAVIAGMGGVLAVGIALVGTRALMYSWQTLPDMRPFPTSVEFGTGMLLWAIGGTAVATLLAGLIPAWHDTHIAPQAVLAEYGRTATASRGGVTLQRALVGIQIALAFALVTAAALLARSFTALQGAELGFAVDHVLTFRVAPGPSPSSRSGLDGWLGERLRARPGVLAIGRAADLPLEGDLPRTSYQLRSSASEDRQRWSAGIRHVDEGYHAALDIAILEGRGLGVDAADGIVVNRRLARRHWPAGPAVGEALDIGGERRVIIGVAADTREWGPHAEGPPLIYERRAGGEMWIVRLAPNVTQVADQVAELVGAFDPGAAVHDMVTMRERLRGNTARSELLTTTMTVFAALALLLAVGGVHASVAHATAQRTRELAIRRALGATSAAIARLVLRQGVALAAGGIVAGAGMAVASGRVLQRVLPNVSAQDPTAFLAAAAALTAAVLLACAASARRAVMTEPVDALRHD